MTSQFEWRAVLKHQDCDSENTSTELWLTAVLHCDTFVPRQVQDGIFSHAAWANEHFRIDSQVCVSVGTSLWMLHRYYTCTLYTQGVCWKKSFSCCLGDWSHRRMISIQTADTCSWFPVSALFSLLYVLFSVLSSDSWKWKLCECSCCRLHTRVDSLLGVLLLMDLQILLDRRFPVIRFPTETWCHSGDITLEKASPRPQKAFNNWFTDIETDNNPDKKFLCSWPVTLKYWENTEISLIWSFFTSCLCFMFLESVSRDESQGPSPELLASLRSLGENSDYTLLPHSLHQVCVMVWEHTVCEEYSRGNSQRLYLVCVRECAYIHSTSLPAPRLHRLCEHSKSQSVRRTRQCSSLHLQMACKWKLWLCLLFKGQLFESVLQHRCRIWTPPPICVQHTC